MSFAARAGTAGSAGSGGSTRRPSINPAAALGRHNHVARLALARGGPGGDAPASSRSEAGAGKGRPGPPSGKAPLRSAVGTPTPFGSSPRVLKVHGEDSPSCEIPATAGGKGKCICELCTCGYVHETLSASRRRTPHSPSLPPALHSALCANTSPPPPLVPCARTLCAPETIDAPCTLSCTARPSSSKVTQAGGA
jgi:hypothetical protein